MDGRDWFINTNDEIVGPFSMAQTRNYLSQKNHRREVHLWARGQTQWLSSEQWRRLSERQAQEEKEEQEKIWYVVSHPNAEQSTPLNQSQMMGYLKTIEDFSETILWTEGMKEWRGVHSFHKITDDLGIPRRRYSRANIFGQLSLSDLNQNITYTAQAKTISEGGMGLLVPNGIINIRQVYQLTYNGSPDIPSPIRAMVEVVHLEKCDKNSNQSHCNLRFIQIDQAHLASIIEYVMKKTHDSSHLNLRAA